MSVPHSVFHTDASSKSLLHDEVCQRPRISSPASSISRCTPCYFDDVRRVTFCTIDGAERRPEGTPHRSISRLPFVFLFLFILATSYFFGTYVTFRHAKPVLEDAFKTCEEKAAGATIEQKACNSGAVTNLLCNLSRTVVGIFSG